MRKMKIAKPKNQNGGASLLNWHFSICPMYFVLAFFLLPFLSTLCARSASAQNLQQVIEGAKKEGQVRVYWSMRKETTKAITDAFRGKYPFIGKVEHTRFSGLEESERVLAELRAGRIEMDVLLVRSEVWDRHKPFLAPPADWKALGVQADRIKKGGLETIWAGGSIAGIAYNAKLVPPEKAPAKWEDCTDPAWKGRFIVNTRPIFMMHLMPAWGEEKVVAFARRIAANQPVWEKDQTVAMEKVALGEAPLYCGGDHFRWAEVEKKGTGGAVKLATPEPVPASEGRGISLVKGAKYPNAGKLFMAFMASDEAQTLIDKMEQRGHRSVPGTMAYQLTKGKKVSEFTEEWDLRSKDLSKKIVEAWGFPVAK